MALTADQYKAKFDNAQSKANSNLPNAFDKSVAWSQVGGVWSYLWVEQRRIDKQKAANPAFQVSAAALGYQTAAENALNSGEARINTVLGQNPAVAAAYSGIASNAAFAYAETVRVDNMVVT